MTIDDLKAALPERLRKYDISPPLTDPSDLNLANFYIAYLQAAMQEMAANGPAILTLDTCTHCGKKLP